MANVQGVMLQPPPTLGPTSSGPPPGQPVMDDSETLFQEWLLWVADTHANPTTYSAFTSAFEKHYLPLLSQEFKDMPSPLKSRNRALHFCGRFCNFWLRWAAEREGSPRKGLEGMIKAFRVHFFRGQASDLPDVHTVLEVFGEHLSKGQKEMLQEYILHGADSLHLRPGTTTRKPHPDNPPLAVLAELFKEMATEGAARRAFVFLADEPGIPELLQQAGVHVSSIVTTPKTADDGKVRVGDDGEDLLRLCINCSDGDDAINIFVRSYNHTAQKTTSPEVVAREFLKEDREYPAYVKLAVKHDIDSAFRKIGDSLRTIGQFASKLDLWSASHSI